MGRNATNKKKFRVLRLYSVERRTASQNRLLTEYFTNKKQGFQLKTQNVTLLSSCVIVNFASNYTGEGGRLSSRGGPRPVIYATDSPSLASNAKYPTVNCCSSVQMFEQHNNEPNLSEQEKITDEG